MIKSKSLMKIKINRKRTNEGFNLIMSIIILLFFSVLSITLVSLFSSDTSVTVDSMLSSKALYLAESGMNYAMEKLSCDLITDPKTKSDKDWSNDGPYLDRKVEPGIDDLLQNLVPGDLAALGSTNIYILYKNASKYAATIESTGQIGDVRRTIMRDFTHTYGLKKWPDSDREFKYTYLVGSIMNIPGNKFIEPPYKSGVTKPVIDTDVNVEVDFDCLSYFFTQTPTVVSWVHPTRGPLNAAEIAAYYKDNWNNFNGMIDGEKTDITLKGNFYQEAPIKILDFRNFIIHGSICTKNKIEILNIDANIIIMQNDPNINIALAAGRKITIANSMTKGNFRSKGMIYVGDNPIIIRSFNNVNIHGFIYSRENFQAIDIIDIEGGSTTISGSVVAGSNADFSNNDFVTIQWDDIVWIQPLCTTWGGRFIGDFTIGRWKETY